MRSVILGTAQWGLNYGVTNAAGRVGEATLTELISLARALDITRLDTASTYGDAESRIRVHAQDFQLQTKVATSGQTIDEVLDAIRETQARSGTARIDACLIHDWHKLESGHPAIAATALTMARTEGLVDRIGVSCYTVEDLRRVIGEFNQVDVVQIPLSILDQRLDGVPEILELHSLGVEMQVRSVFLQGITLGRPGHPFMSHPDVRRLREIDVDPLTLSLSFVGSREWVDSIIVAPTTVSELRAIHRALTGPLVAHDWSMLASTDESLIDPRTWLPQP